jgi:hypothetical protein
LRDGNGEGDSRYGTFRARWRRRRHLYTWYYRRRPCLHIPAQPFVTFCPVNAASAENFHRPRAVTILGYNVSEPWNHIHKIYEVCHCMLPVRWRQIGALSRRIESCANLSGRPFLALQSGPDTGISKIAEHIVPGLVPNPDLRSLVRSAS